MTAPQRPTPRRFGACALALVVAVSAMTVLGQGREQQTFATPEEAVAALVAAVRANDSVAFTRVVGAGPAEISSGDQVQDTLSMMTFASRLLRETSLVKIDETTMTLRIGLEQTPFAAPLVKRSERWAFDLSAGRRELAARRISQNELRAVEISRIYVRAQKEYAAEDRDGDKVLEFAQRFNSTPGTRDGLFWFSNDFASESPLGALASLARAEGYQPQRDASRPPIFHGYYFKLLTRQGAGAPGGAKEFVVGENMTEGFAAVAYPVHWGASGTMTFLVGPDGIVLRKDLGERTAEVAAAIDRFDPDATWTPADR